MPQEILTPEQFFEKNNVGGDYIRKEDFLEYCDDKQLCAYNANVCLSAVMQSAFSKLSETELRQFAQGISYLKSI